jgi:alkylation response protein AidB-like acyl-CoA dehydrogenase
MNLSETAAERAFRGEVRAWLAANLPEEWTQRADSEHDADEEFEIQRAWQRRLYDGGWAAVHWPAAHGGRGLSPIEHYIFVEELAAHRAPDIVNRIGVNLVGPTLFTHGTEDLQRRFLRPLLAADEIWCQLFSEPGAGSDLASLQCRAERGHDHYVLHGQKVWTSWAAQADFGLALVRTAPEKHAGITCLLVPMRQDGVEVRPLVQMTGSAEFNEVFFDGAHVPVEYRVGEENDGWRVATTTLGYERGASVRQYVLHRAALGELAPLRPDRQRYASAWTELEILRLLNWRTMSALAHGEAPGASSSVTKLFWSEMSQRLYDLALDALGPRAAAPPAWWRTRHLYSRATTIFAGSSEIQRNVLAERVLGLPR